MLSLLYLNSVVLLGWYDVAVSTGIAAAIVADHTGPAAGTLSLAIMPLLLALGALITLSSACVAWLLRGMLETTNTLYDTSHV